MEKRAETYDIPVLGRLKRSKWELASLLRRDLFTPT
jgi:hypothetical protein